jgi:hypothetical protein
MQARKGSAISDSTPAARATRQPDAAASAWSQTPLPRRTPRRLDVSEL